jgi:hypothetical protein
LIRRDDHLPGVPGRVLGVDQEDAGGLLNSAAEANQANDFALFRSVSALNAVPRPCIFTAKLA